MADERGKAIELAFAQIEKQFGKGSIMRLGSKEAIVPIAVIRPGRFRSTRRWAWAGFPRGRVIEMFGPESSGKTTITLQVIAEAQKTGGMAAFIDAEHALDPGYAKKLGVDVDNLLVSQPDYGEQALEITETLVRSNAIDVLVVDSVAALVPKAELDGEMGDSHMGLQARLMSQALRKLTGTVSQVAHLPDLHQPDSRKNWRDVRQSGDHDRRKGAEILFLGAHRYPAHRGDQRRRRSDRFAHSRKSREEQGGGAVPRGRVRHPLRGRDFTGRRSARFGLEQQHRREIRVLVQL
jgi:hypothetical protein